MDTATVTNTTVLDTTAVMADLKAQLLREALSIIQNTKEGVIKGFQYIWSQIPDIIKQFLNWELAVGVIMFFLGVIIILLGMHFYKRIDTFIKSLDEKAKADAWGFQYFPSVIGSVIGFLFVIFNLMKIVQILVAPKIFLIKWILVNASYLHR